MSVIIALAIGLIVITLLSIWFLILLLDEIRGLVKRAALDALEVQKKRIEIDNLEIA